MICRHCEQPFDEQHRTKRHVYCVACGPIVERIKARERDIRRRRRKGQPVCPGKMKRCGRKPARMVRYAGFDPTERRI